VLKKRRGLKNIACNIWAREKSPGKVAIDMPFTGI